MAKCGRPRHICLPPHIILRPACSENTPTLSEHMSNHLGDYDAGMAASVSSCFSDITS